MFMPIVNRVRWMWSDLLLPYVVLALAALVSDGVEAWANIGETLYVMGCFLVGRSHRAYPLPVKELDRRKRQALESLRAEAQTVRGAVDGEDSGDDAASEGNSSSTAAPPGDAERTTRAKSGGPAWGPEEAGGAAPVYVQRRVLLGKKGERERWLAPVPGRPLVPPSFPQSYSHSLHRLVLSVVGPIQQPTVTTLPARHAAPQWPPHFVRSSCVGGPAGAGGGTASTDDYSSSSHPLRWRQSGGGAGSSSSAGEGPGRGAAPRRGGPGDYQQNAKVVYKRQSKRQMEFQRSRKHMGDAQAIASITAHHVLSYRATRQKVLAIDLDETLCHVSTSTADMLGPPTFSEVIPTTTGAELFHVWERPHVRLFLETMSKLFNLVLFTSASKPYADTILRRIDPHYLLKERYYRQDCRVVSRGALAKALREKRQAAAGSTREAAAAATAATSATASAAEHEDPLGRSNATARGSAHDPASSSSPSLRQQQQQQPPGQAAGAPPGSGWHDAFLHDSERPPLNEKAKVLMKDLRILKVPMELLVMIDNTEECLLINRDNALIISPFIPSFESHRMAATSRRASSSVAGADEDPGGFGDPEEDEVLLSLMTFLEAMLVVPDVRSILRHGRIY